MKKKTVITTEKREVWVIREAAPEPLEDRTIDNVIDASLPAADSHEAECFDTEEEL